VSRVPTLDGAMENSLVAHLLSFLLFHSSSVTLISVIQSTHQEITAIVF